MSTYEDVYNYSREEIPLMEDETVLWKGKPKKVAFIFGQASQGFAIAVLWLCIDAFFIANVFATETGSQLFFIIPFFALHLMPVWIWLKNFLTASKRWKNTFYCVTDRRILISDGFFAENYHTIYYKEIQSVNLHIGFFDKIFNTGDVMLELNNYFTTGSKNKVTNKGGFFDISDFMKVYKLVQKTVLDVQTDIEYPNAYRPDSNPGYNTRYESRHD